MGPVHAYVIVVFLYGWIFVGVCARYHAADAKRGNAPKVTVRLTGDAEDLGSGAGGAWTYPGAVSGYVFAYDPEATRVVVLPVNAVARVEPLRGRKAEMQREAHAAPVAARP